MTIVLARELERLGVRVNAIAPVARTRLTEATPGAGEFMQAKEGEFDRFAPENVAAVVGWLASDLSDGVSGQVVKVQGGVAQIVAGLAPGHRDHRRQAVDHREHRRRPRRAVREDRAGRAPVHVLARGLVGVELAWGPDEEAFRAELATFLDANAPPEARGRDFAAGRRGRRRHPRLGARLAGDAVRPRLAGARLPARARRPQRHARADADLPGGDGRPGPPPGAALPRLRHRRAQPARVRHRRAEGAGARGAPRRHRVVHRHERARRGLRPRLALDARRARRRPVRRQRPEGLDVVRDVGAEVLPLRPHRPGRAQAQGDQRPDPRHGHAGHRRAAAAPHHRQRRLRRGVLHRRRSCRARTSSGP